MDLITREGGFCPLFVVTGHRVTLAGGVAWQLHILESGPRVSREAGEVLAGDFSCEGSISTRFGVRNICPELHMESSSMCQNVKKDVPWALGQVFVSQTEDEGFTWWGLYFVLISRLLLLCPDCLDPRLALGRWGTWSPISTSSLPPSKSFHRVCCIEHFPCINP